MKKREAILIGVGAALASVVGVKLARSRNRLNRLNNVAAEGYETAHDILYPSKEHKKARLKFGPVLPHD